MPWMRLSESDGSRGLGGGIGFTDRRAFLVTDAFWAFGRPGTAALVVWGEGLRGAGFPAVAAAAAAGLLPEGWLALAAVGGLPVACFLPPVALVVPATPVFFFATVFLAAVTIDFFGAAFFAGVALPAALRADVGFFLAVPDGLPEWALRVAFLATFLMPALPAFRLAVAMALIPTKFTEARDYT